MRAYKYSVLIKYLNERDSSECATSLITKKSRYDMPEHFVLLTTQSIYCKIQTEQE